jgi:nitrate reductase gamma subunit
MDHGFLDLLKHQISNYVHIYFVLGYAARLGWLFYLKCPKETPEPKGSKTYGICWSLATIVMPWALESTRKHFITYVEFAVFHIGIAFALASTFIIPHAPQWYTPASISIFTTFMGVAFIIGMWRLARRIFNADIRAISGGDDYFSLIMVNLILFTGYFAVRTMSDLSQTLFLVVALSFMIYVPFSKIWHYLYWPFARYFFGAHFGRRGVLGRPAWREE